MTKTTTKTSIGERICQAVLVISSYFTFGLITVGLCQVAGMSTVPAELIAQAAGIGTGLGVFWLIK